MTTEAQTFDLGGGLGTSLETNSISQEPYHDKTGNGHYMLVGAPLSNISSVQAIPPLHSHRPDQELNLYHLGNKSSLSSREQHAEYLRPKAQSSINVWTNSQKSTVDVAYHNGPQELYSYRNNQRSGGI